MKKFLIFLVVFVFTTNGNIIAQGAGVKKLILKEKSIELRTHVRLHYVEQGDPDGIPVILLHGISDSRHSFDMILPYLPPSLHVFAISQRGHGNSSKPVQNYHPEDFAKDIAAFIEKKKLGSVVIVGHSMGSTNAQCFAANYPSLVKGLILAGSFADYKKQMIQEFKKVIDGLNDPVDTSFAAEFQRSTLAKQIPEEMLNKFISESCKLPAYVWKGVAAGWNSADYQEALKSFDKPALIVWGDRDAYCPRADQDKLVNTIQTSKLLVYEGAGHAPHWEEPERFAGDLVKFISRSFK